MCNIAWLYLQSRVDNSNSSLWFQLRVQTKPEAADFTGLSEDDGADALSLHWITVLALPDTAFLYLQPLFMALHGARFSE